MRQFIYADNAATTRLDSASLEAMTPWLLEEYGNASQPYTFSRKQKGRWQRQERPSQSVLVHRQRRYTSPPAVPRATTGSSKALPFLTWESAL